MPELSRTNSGYRADLESVVLTASAAAPSSGTLRFLRADPGDSQLVLYWHAPLDENGQAIRDHDYQYRYKTDGGTFGSWISFFARFVRHDEMQLFVGDLSNGTPYTVEVRAVRNGVGGEAASVTATPGSPDATLSALGLTSISGTIALSPPFPSTRRGGLRYTSSVTHDVTSVTVTATPNNADAQVAFDPVTDADAVAEGHQVALVVGETVIWVTVTAKNGATKKTYIVTVDRAAPPALSVADAEATEGDDATLDFVVTLDPAATATVTVDYATADGTATAGDDYTGTSGTLTFAVGETTKTVSVPIIDDLVEDDGETLTLTLSNAAGAEIDDATATGTIRNSETAAEAADRQLRERAGRARRQHTVHLRRRLQQRHRNQLRDAARPLVHGHKRESDRRPPQQRAERQLGDHRHAVGQRGDHDHATRQPRLRDNERHLHQGGQPGAAEQQPVCDSGRAAGLYRPCR